MGNDSHATLGSIPNGNGDRRRMTTIAVKWPGDPDRYYDIYRRDWLRFCSWVLLTNKNGYRLDSELSETIVDLNSESMVSYLSLMFPHLSIRVLK